MGFAISAVVHLVLVAVLLQRPVPSITRDRPVQRLEFEFTTPAPPPPNVGPAKDRQPRAQDAKPRRVIPAGRKPAKSAPKPPARAPHPTGTINPQTPPVTSPAPPPPTSRGSPTSAPEDDAPRRLPSVAEAVATETRERARKKATRDPTNIFPLIAELDGTIGRAIDGQPIPDREVLGGVDSRGWGQGPTADGSKRIQSGRVSGRIALDGSVEFDEPGAGKVDLPFLSEPLVLLEQPSLDEALRGHGHPAKLAPSVGIVGGSFDTTEALMLALGKDPHHLDKRRILRSTEAERVRMRRASDAVSARQAMREIQDRMERLCRSLAALDDKRSEFAELLDDCAQTRLGREAHDVILAAWRKCDPDGAPSAPPNAKTSSSETTRD